jgi:drug/metabolite transporter (DMT)-like permease
MTFRKDFFMKRFRGEAFLLLAAIVWGSAFIFQKMGMDYIGPLTFGAFRFTIGAIALLPVIYFADCLKRKHEQTKEITSFKNRTLIVGGLLCGIACFVASSFQQIGIVYTTAGKAGFITSMNILIVPLFMIFLRKKVGIWTWIAVAVGCFGMYLLCITDGFTIKLGDGLVMICAIFYAVQILVIDYFVEKVDAIKLAFYQFVVAGVLSLITALMFETIDLTAVVDCAVPILYTAILEVSVAFTLQMVGQKNTNPAIAAILLSLESIFAAICGCIFLGEVMTVRETLGCVIMFGAFIITQIPGIQAICKDHKGKALT